MTDKEMLEAVRAIMKEELEPVKEDISSLKEDTAALKTDVATLKTDVSGLKEDTAVLKTDVATLKTDVSSLKEDTAALKTDVAVLKTDVSSLKEDTAILKEESSITRTAVNKLLDWADDASIQIVPLFKKAKYIHCREPVSRLLFLRPHFSGSSAGIYFCRLRREKKGEGFQRGYEKRCRIKTCIQKGSKSHTNAGRACILRKYFLYTK